MSKRLGLCVVSFLLVVPCLRAQTGRVTPPVRPAGPDARGVLGAGRAVRVNDITSGALRGQLEKLSPKARDTALARLEGMTFHKNDIPSLRTDQTGGIHYKCTFDHAGDHTHEHVTGPAVLDKKADEPGVAHAAVPNSSPPVYHSRAGAPYTLFLDFNGHIIENTYWNDDPEYGSVSRWNAQPYDTDGNTNSFSDTEQSAISQIWQRVSEDYAGFNVDVTTEQPSWSRYVGHALITATNDASGQATPHAGAGGIAYVNVFGDIDNSYNYAGRCYSPAWVKPMSIANTAEAASHELGHNLGLSHDGTSVLEYYSGHVGDVTAPSWGPIMGTGYGRNVSQWSKGGYYDANNTQDDLAIIAGKLGYLTDDYGDTIGTASPIAQTGVVVTAVGVVETEGDSDVFALPSGAGTISLSLDTLRMPSGTWGGNPDLALVLYNSGGSVLASNNPAADVDASISVAVAAGTYYAQVLPVGAGDPLAASPRGYTSYGSVGTYVLSGTVAALGDTVAVTQPNGGETIYHTSTNTITWSAGFTNGVNLYLFKGGAYYSTLSTGEPNDGSYTWVVTTNVTIGTDYRVRISKNGVPGNFDQSDANFSIAGTRTLLIDEDFDDSGTLPSGWSQSQVTGVATWAVQSGGQTGGSNPGSAFSAPNNVTLYRQSTGDNKTRLFTPAFDSLGYTNVTLTFRHCMVYWPPDQDYLTVFYRTSAAAPWVIIAGYSNDVPSWTERAIELPALGPDCTIAFEGNAKYGYGVCLDDVVVTASGVLDSDGDGLPDWWEQDYFEDLETADGTSDTDGDGFTDLEEFTNGTNPTVPNRGANDFDGDGISDIGVYVPVTGSWAIQLSGSGSTRTETFGYTGTVPVVGDFDGDGVTDFGCYDAAGIPGLALSGSWYIMQSRDGFRTERFGYVGTVPITGDFDGDGTADFGCYDAAGIPGLALPGSWYIMQSRDGFRTERFGYVGTVPITGDFDGDGTADFGCYDAAGIPGLALPGSWYIMQSSNGFRTETFGYVGTVPIVGDFDGDGSADFGCYDAAGIAGLVSPGAWYIMQSAAGFRTETLGYAGTVPIAGDYDGDGIVDFGCYNSTLSAWYIMQSTDGFFGTTFGSSGATALGSP